jgi:hypothetical protein
VRDVPTIPPVWINEVHPINTTGITDMNGERDPWLELHNTGSSPVFLTDWALSDDPASLTKFTFPAGTSVPAGGYLLVWMDGSAVSPLQEIHANFRLSASGGTVYLSMRQSGIPVLADYVQYTSAANQSFGSPGDDGPIARRTLSASTPGTANGGTAGIGVTLTFQRNAGFPAVGWESIQGRQYTVEATSDLEAETWQSMQQFTGNGSLLLYTDSSSPRPETRFYRVRSN